MTLAGWSVYLPGVPLADATGGAVGGGWARLDAPPPEKAAAVLGRKGLLYKEPATRLALCAVHRALGLEPGQRPDWPLDPRTAVVAASNLGNVETVAKITRAVAAEGGKAVSVLDAPNASSNIVASTVALWFRFGGPNLMLCSGATAGADALRLAGVLLRARRADRVVVVGAEPADEVASALHSLDGVQLRAGAACLLLHAWPPPPPAEQPLAPAEQPLDDVEFPQSYWDDVTSSPKGGAPKGRAPKGGAPSRRAVVELVPDGAPWPAAPRGTVGAGGFDPVARWGDCYGAQVVVSVALAAHLAFDEGYGAVGVLDSGASGARALVSTLEEWST